MHQRYMQSHQRSQQQLVNLVNQVHIVGVQRADHAGLFDDLIMASSRLQRQDSSNILETERMASHQIQGHNSPKFTKKNVREPPEA